MDAAFKPRPYAGYTTAELRNFLNSGKDVNREAMIAEVARRERVVAGDESVMTPAERLRKASGQEP